jgi:hypothetical protein
MANKSYASIYGEIVPDRIDKASQSVTKEYPSELIISIEGPDSPKLSEITKTIRTHILECTSSSIDPVIILNIISNRVDPEPDVASFTYFVALTEYLNDIKAVFDSVKFLINCRGVFTREMNLLILAASSLDSPIKLSKHTLHRPLLLSDYIPLSIPSEYIKNLGLTQNEFQLDYLIKNNFLTY